MTPKQYFSEALHLFETLTSYQSDCLELADRRVELRTPSSELRDLFLPSLAHLLKDCEDKPSDLVIWYAADGDLPTKLKAPPWFGFNAQGINNSLEDDDVEIFHQPWQNQIFLYSRSKKIGIYWVLKPEDVPWWECTFSFRIIFHFWTLDLPAQLVHAGAIAKGDRALLITGKSGSGKSTSCLNLLKAGFEYLGDDYVWIELGEELSVHTLYRTAKIEADNLEERFADWSPKIVNQETYNQQKAIFYIDELFPNSLVLSKKLAGILLPTVMNQSDTTYDRVNSLQSLMAMAPTTLHHLPHRRELSYKKLQKISTKLPNYRWSLGTDIDSFLNTFTSILYNDQKEA